MASNKSFQQVTSTDSGEKPIEIQPINETQKERDLASFVTTHSPSFLSQVQNSSLIPEKNAALFSSTPLSFGFTSENNNIKNELILGKVVNTETKMENNNSKDKQDVKPALPTEWKPPSSSYSSGVSSAFSKPSANPTTGSSNNLSTVPKTSAPTLGFGLTQSKESKPQETPTLTASKPSLPTNSFGSLVTGNANVGTGVSQPKPSISNTSQATNFNVATKSGQDTKPVSTGNPVQGVPSSNPISAFGAPKPTTNVVPGLQAPKSEAPLSGSNNNGSSFLSQSANVAKGQGSLISSTSGSLKGSSPAISSAVKTNPYVLPTSASNTVLKEPKPVAPSEKQYSVQAAEKNVISGTGQFSSNPGGTNTTKPNQDNHPKPDVSHKVLPSSSNVQHSNKPASSVNPAPSIKPISSSGVQVPLSKNDSSNIAKVPADKPISVIGQSYGIKPASSSNQPSLSKPVSTPVVQPAVPKPILPEVTQPIIPKPAPPKVTQATVSAPTAPQSTVSKPVVSQSDSSNPVVIQRTTPKSAIHAVNQSTASKPASITSQNTVTTKASTTSQSVAGGKNNDTEKEHKLPTPTLSKNLSSSNEDGVLNDSKAVSSQSQTKKETLKPSEEQLVHNSDASKKENNESKQVAKDEFKKPSDVGPEDFDNVSKVSEGSDIPSKPISQGKTLGKNLSVSFSEKNDAESDKNSKADAISPEPPKPASGTKRSSEEITKKQDVKPANKSKKTKSGAFINEIPDRKENIGELLICGKGSSQLGTTEKNAELLELTLVEKLPSNIVDVSCGLNHTLALTSDGDIYSWGVNSEHALGRKGDTSVPTKVEFDDEVAIVQIAAGNSFSAALTDSGKVYAWGVFFSDEQVLGFYESAGNSQETPTKIGDKLPKGTEFTQIVAGKDHLLLLTSKGRVYAMGDMKYGQLGVRLLRQKKDDDMPQGLRLNCLLLKNVVQIAAGSYHSFAINKNDEVYSWGQNNYCQCGIPSSSLNYDTVIEIPTKSVSIMNLGECSLFGGDSFTLALNEEGELYGFGLAEGGLLGVPMEKTSFSNIGDKKVLEEPEHILFPNSAEVTHVATGSNYSIVCAASKLYSWGTELVATGHSEAVNLPTVINTSNSENLLMLSAGYTHSTFLVASSDTMC